MSRRFADQFMDALRDAERRHDPEPLVGLFTDDAEAASLTRRHAAKGRDEVRRFWREYLDLFQQIASEFTNVVASEGAAALEWRSRGRLRDGRPIDYRGVSVIEVEGDRVKRFRTYYDSAVFVSGALATAG